MGLNSDKTSKVFFVLIFAVLLPIFFCTTVAHSHPSFIKIVVVFDLDTPQYQNVHCAVSSNQYQGNGFGAEVLLGCAHPRVVLIGPIVKGVIAFPILGT